MQNDGLQMKFDLSQAKIIVCDSFCETEGVVTSVNADVIVGMHNLCTIAWCWWLQVIDQYITIDS